MTYAKIRRLAQRINLARVAADKAGCHKAARLLLAALVKLLLAALVRLRKINLAPRP